MTMRDDVQYRSTASIFELLRLGIVVHVMQRCNKTESTELRTDTETLDDDCVEI